VVLNRLRRYDDALGSYERALEIEPDSVVIMQNIGTLLFRKLGRKDEAVAVFAQILRLEPGRWFEWPADIREAVDGTGRA
jgi:tetratricopeptide (TPR) repeat protein